MYRAPNLRSSLIHGRVPTAILPVARSRTYATQPPPEQASPNPKVSPSTDGGGHNNGLIIASAVAALGGMYYFYNRDRGVSLQEKKRRDEEDMKRAAHAAQADIKEFGEAGKARAEDGLKETQEKYDVAKTSAKEKVTGSRQKVDESRYDLTEQARQTAHEAQAKLNQYKNAAEQSLADVRKTSEQKIEETKDAVTHRAEEAKDAGQGWFGWGQSKTDEAKREGAQKVAEGAEDVKKRAERQV